MSGGTVLLTGARAPVCLDLARAFRAAGWHVHLADCIRPHAARALRPRVPIHALPSPRVDFAGFRRAMLALVEALDPVLVVPTCEEVFWLAAAAAHDDWAARLFAPPLPVLAQLHSKLAFAQLAAALGLNVPPTWVFDPQRPLPIPREKAVLKPEFSRFATHTLVAPSAAELATVTPTPQRRWAVQQRILGTELCSWAAIHRGRVMAFAAYAPRWRHGRAAGYGFAAVDSPAVRAVTERVAAATAMTGHLSFDLILDGDGRAWPIECNPRAVSGLHLFDAAPALVAAILGEAVLAEPPAGRLRHLAPAMVLLGLPEALRQRRLGALRRDWQAGADALGRASPRVILGALRDAARFALAARRGRRSPAGATTADIEWDGEPMS